MMEYYNQNLQDWDSVVRVYEHDSKVAVKVRRQADAIHGVFVIVADDHSVVVINAVCELTPERIKQVARGATMMGMNLGLEKAIQEAVHDLQQELE